MGANISTQVLVNSRIEIIDKILDNLKSWNDNVELGIRIIEKNQVEFDHIKHINDELSKLILSTNDEKEYKDKLDLIVEEQNKLLLKLKNSQDCLLEGMKELNKRSKVMNSYISVKQGTVFVDKDV